MDVAKAYRFERSVNGLGLSVSSVPQVNLAPRQVRIKVHAVSLNYRDLFVMRGESGEIPDGRIPVSDAAGEVVEIGSAVTRWRVGDRVSPNFFAEWPGGHYRRHHLPSALGGENTDGVLSEFVVASEDAVTGIPSHLTYAEGACLPCAAVTAWVGLVERGGLKENDVVLIQGTGGVALFALQIASAFGAHPIVLSSSDAKLERCKAIGAWKTINYRTRPDWEHDVLALTDGEGADHIVELGGPDTFDNSIACVAAGGKIAQIGVLSGFSLRPDLLQVLFLNVQINGICVGSGEHFAAMNRFLEERQIRPIIDRLFSFEDVPAAYEYLASGQHFGKVVIEL